MVARGAKRSIKVATASHFLFADCRFIAGVLVVGVKQGRGGFCSGWLWCRTAADIKHLFLTLDVYHLRFRLFPEPLLRSLKSGNSPSAQTARIFTFTPQMLFFGNNLRLDGTHLRLDEFFCRSPSCTASLPEFGLMQLFCAAAYFRNHGSSR